MFTQFFLKFIDLILQFSLFFFVFGQIFADVIAFIDDAC